MRNVIAWRSSSVIFLKSAMSSPSWISFGNQVLATAWS